MDPHGPGALLLHIAAQSLGGAFTGWLFRLWLGYPVDENERRKKRTLWILGGAIAGAMMAFQTWR